jgi:hypothetical protein
MVTGSSHPATLNDEWQGTIELALERGEIPLLNLGAGVGLLENIPALVALHAFARARRDVATATVIVGGAPMIWLAALLHDPEVDPQPASQQSPPLQIMYSGPDLATQSAALETLSPPARTPPTPLGLVSLLAPASQSGAPLWETLPLLLALTPDATAQPAATPVQGDPWLSWLGGGLALLLVIFAFLL